ncbi:MAG: TolC family protein [Gammaproteobacteria bacterium]|nr:TolC family protein [Gammaproteobacteria bacterium]
MIRTGVFVFCCIFAQSLLAEQRLPEPLTLEHALSLAEDVEHHQLIEANAMLELANSELKRAVSSYALQADIELQAAAIDPSPIAFDQSSNDSYARLRVRKPLYDFGQTREKTIAAEDEMRAVKNNIQYLVDQRRIEIARRFFDVIKADLKFAWDNEAMAVMFIRHDDQKDRHSLSQISDVDLLASDNDYQNIRYQRYISETKQRTSRAFLAEQLNAPSSLPANLVMPELQFHKRKLPEFEALLDQAMLNNLTIKLANTKVESAYRRMQAARYQTRPRLDAELKVSEYARDAGSYEDWRAEINLVIPLLEHDGIQADVARERSKWMQQRAMLLDIKSNVRQRVLDLWQQISLLSTRREQIMLSLDYRELSLDKNRALYEMEVKTNLGSAMVAISEVRFKQAEVDFNLALAWMELDLLTGKNLQDEIAKIH